MSGRKGGIGLVGGNCLNGWSEKANSMNIQEGEMICCSIFSLKVFSDGLDVMPQGTFKQTVIMYS